MLRLDGGEAERWTELPMGVQSPKWTADGKRIVFVSTVFGESLETTKTEVARREKDEKTRVKATVSENRVVRYWDHWLETDQWAHLFALDVETRKVTDLTPGMKRLGKLDDGGLAFDVARDGSVVFAANSTEPPYRTTNTDLFLVPAGGGAPRNLTADNPAEDGSPVFSPDGKTIAYGRETKADGWPDRTRLALLDLATGKTRVLTEEWDSVPDDWSFTPDGKTLVFRAEVARADERLRAAGRRRNAAPRLEGRPRDGRRDRGHLRPRLRAHELPAPDGAGDGEARRHRASAT